MLDFLHTLPPLVLVVIATGFTWGVTALGSALVFFFHRVNRRVLDAMMGFSAGVMIAASYFSLLAPAIDLSVDLGYIPYLFPALGFLFGGIFVLGAAKLLDRSNRFSSMPNGAAYKRCILLVSSITLHNIPEGLSIGVAFGAMASGVPGCDVVGGLLLALGIGLQNFPEGASVSLPLRREGASRSKAFFLGQASGFVEPIAALLGFFLATWMRGILPFALAFSAGAMISVAASELIPESCEQNKSLATLGCILGFVVMMVMDVALS